MVIHKGRHLVRGMSVCQHKQLVPACADCAWPGSACYALAQQFCRLCSQHQLSTTMHRKCSPQPTVCCAQAMGIQRYLFFSIHNCQNHPNVPLMRIKSASEDFLQQSGVPYTIFRLCGFMQVQVLDSHGKCRAA